MSCFEAASCAISIEEQVQNASSPVAVSQEGVVLDREQRQRRQVESNVVKFLTVDADSSALAPASDHVGALCADQ